MENNIPQKYSTGEHQAGTKEAKPTYQTPVAMPLGELATGWGQSGNCQPSGGEALGGKCQTGGRAGTIKCQTGSTAYEGKCDTGSNALSGTCQTGDTAQGCSGGSVLLAS